MRCASSASLRVCEGGGLKLAGFSFLIALSLAALVTGALVIWTCGHDSRDACYIMQGMAVYLGPILLIVLWPIAYGGYLIVRMIRRPPEF